MSETEQRLLLPELWHMLCQKWAVACGLHVTVVKWLQARVSLKKKYCYRIPKYLLIMCNAWTCFIDITKYIKYYRYLLHQTQYPELCLVFSQWNKFGMGTKMFPYSITAIFIHLLSIKMYCCIFNHTSKVSEIICPSISLNTNLTWTFFKWVFYLIM
jgi:hypothetical protein